MKIRLNLFCIFAAFLIGMVSTESKANLSWVPILGYNPTYRFFGGGGFFYEKKERAAFGVHGVITQDAVLKIQLTSYRYLNPKLKLNFDNEIARGFEPNFGAGNATLVNDRVNVDLIRNLAEMRLEYFVDPSFSIGLLFDSRVYRREQVIPGEVAPYPRRGDSFGFGIQERLDFRSNPESPTFGWYQSATARVIPAATQSIEGMRESSFMLLESDIRVFQFILDERLVMAYQLAGGVAIGQPTYLYQFRLGGADRMRGFLENRFRGSRFYVQQSELRFPIYRAIGGATYVEFGEATSGAFKKPSLSYGVGLRIGLPPDYLAKVRIEFAVSRDQQGVLMDFGQPF